MPREIEGVLVGRGKRIAIVVSRFNQLVSDPLLQGACDILLRHEVAADDITIARVPGAREIPLATQRLADSEKYDAIICLGAVIRGDTPHFDYVAGEVSRGVAETSKNSGLPVAFGVLTCDTFEQALDRAGGKAGNKGCEAAESALEMANLLPLL